MHLRIGSLFSGIGSLDIAVHSLLDSETVWFVEQEKFCQRHLRHRFPDVPVYDDVCTVNKENLSPIDILVGGFPCQDISQAGRGEGIKDGTRSGLFFEMWRLALELQPRLVLFENVPAINGRGLDVVTETIVEAGWTIEWFCLSASDVGAWHRRERWWGIAHRESSPLFSDYVQVGRLSNSQWSSIQQDLFSPQSLERLPKAGMASSTGMYERSFVPSSDRLGLMYPTPTTFLGRRCYEGAARSIRELVLAGEMSREEGASILRRDPFAEQGILPKISWPTPTSTDYKDGGSEHSIRFQVNRKGTGVRLGSYVPASENKLLPTPVRGDAHKLPSNSLSRHIESGGRKYSADDHRGTGEVVEWLPGKLNPDWVEPLMGLPSGFTDLGCDIGPEMLDTQSWFDGSWEEGIPRLTETRKNRVSRVKALGNSVVPQCAFEAYKVIRGLYERKELSCEKR